MNIKGAGGQTRTQQPRPRHGTGIAVTLAANDLTPPTPPPAPRKDSTSRIPGLLLDPAVPAPTCPGLTPCSAGSWKPRALPHKATANRVSVLTGLHARTPPRGPHQTQRPGGEKRGRVLMFLSRGLNEVPP